MAVISSAEFGSLLPFSSRTIRHALDEVLGCVNIGLREETLPADHIDLPNPHRRIDRRLKPRLYRFGDFTDNGSEIEKGLERT